MLRVCCWCSPAYRKQQQLRDALALYQSLSMVLRQRGSFKRLIGRVQAVSLTLSKYQDLHDSQRGAQVSAVTEIRCCVVIFWPCFAAASGASVTLKMNDRGYLVPACQSSFSPGMYTGLNFLGKTFSYTVDLSKVSW